MFELTNNYGEPIQVDEYVADDRVRSGKTLRHHQVATGAKILLGEPGPVSLFLKKDHKVTLNEISDEELARRKSVVDSAKEMQNVRSATAKVKSGTLTAEALPSKFRQGWMKKSEPEPTPVQPTPVEKPSRRTRRPTDE